MKNWKLYFEKHLNRKPKEQLIKALSFCASKNVALDLGAGTLIESRAILNNGFKKVIAIDNAPDVGLFVKNFNDVRLSFKNISFKEYNFPKNKFDLINAQYALPFNGEKGFNTLFKKIKNSLKNKGVFVGQFFGVKDSWNKKGSDLVFHKKSEVLKLLSGLEVIEFI